MVTSKAIKQAFEAGALTIRSVSPTGDMEWKRVLAVHRAEVGPESIWGATTDTGSMVLTGGHRVFLTPTEKTEMESLTVGQEVLSIVDGAVIKQQIRQMERLPDRQYMYDLTAEDWHNFVLQGSGVVISNSPDKNYRFRPPTGEGEINCYNQVFGYIWTDEELLEYLRISLDKWNMQPPLTEEYCSLDSICQKHPSWKAAILWGAVVHAAMAVAFNWASDEFSISSDTKVTLRLSDGTTTSLTIAELHEIANGNDLREKIKSDLRLGLLQTQAVDPITGIVSWCTVSDVLQHETGHKPMVLTHLADGRSVKTTVDHSLFHRKGEGLEPVEAEKLQVGDTIATVSHNVLSWTNVVSVEVLPPDEFTYDLSVPGPENFVLTNGIVAHNSYSIGGISLDIDKFSKYMQLKENAESQWDKLVEAKSRTVKYIMGLKQQRFGNGVRSAFGPNIGKGVLSPRSFL